MVVDIDGLPGFSEVLLRAAQSVHTAVQHKKDIEGLLLGKIRIDFLKALDPPEDICRRLQKDFHIGIRQAFFQILPQRQTRTHAVPVRPHMPADPYSPGTLALFQNIQLHLIPNPILFKQTLSCSDRFLRASSPPRPAR